MTASATERSAAQPANWSGGTLDMTVAWPTARAVRTYDLAVRLEPGMTRHPLHPPYSYVLSKLHGQHAYPEGITSAMEMVTMGAHVGTHVDAPGHVALHGKVHGGRDVMNAQSPTGGLEVGSVEEVAPIIGQGHLVDAVEIFGRDLTPADGIGSEQLGKWFATHPEPGEGDVVVVRTGWMRLWPDFDAYLGLHAGLPGVTLDGAGWLADRGVIAMGSDTVNFEHKPSISKVSMSVHVFNLVERGIPIMESLNLERLAADAIYDFFFVAVPLRIGGGTGSPLRPLAIVPAPQSARTAILGPSGQLNSSGVRRDDVAQLR
jgi:kynurenine formamidase